VCVVWVIWESVSASANLVLCDKGKLMIGCRIAHGVIHYWAPVAYTECDVPAEREREREREPEPEPEPERPINDPGCPDPQAGT
jgi:hypothetical protein